MGREGRLGQAPVRPHYYQSPDAWPDNRGRRGHSQSYKSIQVYLYILRGASSGLRYLAKRRLRPSATISATSLPSSPAKALSWLRTPAVLCTVIGFLPTREGCCLSRDPAGARGASSGSVGVASAATVDPLLRSALASAPAFFIAAHPSCTQA